MWRSPSLLVVTVALVAAACTSSDDVEVQVATVGSGEVVQTVAAGARLQAADRVTVTAPVSGEVTHLLVADGDQVAAGQVLARLASANLDEQIAQAELAVDAAEGFAAATASAGVDLSPVVSAFRAQLDAVFPPLIGGLGDQVTNLENAAVAADRERAELEADLEAARRDLQDGLDAARRDLEDGLDAARRALEEDADSLDAARRELELDSLDAARRELQGNADVVGPALSEPVADLPPAEVPPIELPSLIDPADLHAAAADARARLAEADAGYRDARSQLTAVEAGLAEQAQQATAAQREAADIQRGQAEAALDAARAQVDDLTIVAPVAGVVELARGGDTGPGTTGLGALGLPGPGSLGSLGDATGGPAVGGGAGALLGGGVGAPTVRSTGPLAVGTAIGAGEVVLTIFDLSGFTARVDVDEIDIVEMEVGQAVTVLVDAYPDAELAGTVRHIAIEPERPVGGGAVFPVTVELEPVPDDVRLRVGMTASAEIEVRRLQADTVVPTSALLRRGGAEVVYVARNGVAIEVPVTIAAIGDDTAAVVGDLPGDARVITTGVELVEDGTPIEVRR